MGAVGSRSQASCPLSAVFLLCHSVSCHQITLPGFNDRARNGLERSEKRGVCRENGKMGVFGAHFLFY